MKLYTIIYIFGKVASFVGPWIDDENAPDAAHIIQVCDQGTKELLERADAEFAKTSVIRDSNGLEVRRKDITAKCEWRDEKPILGK